MHQRLTDLDESMDSELVLCLRVVNPAGASSDPDMIALFGADVVWVKCADENAAQFVRRAAQGALQRPAPPVLKNGVRLLVELAHKGAARG